jgi:hypothetical protein
MEAFFEYESNFIFPTFHAQCITQVLETRHFGRGADKSVGNGFGRMKCVAKPEPQGWGEPIQRPWMASYYLPVSYNQVLQPTDSYRPWPGYRHPCRYDGWA